MKQFSYSVTNTLLKLSDILSKISLFHLFIWTYGEILIMFATCIDMNTARVIEGKHSAQCVLQSFNELKQKLFMQNKSAGRIPDINLHTDLLTFLL